MNSPKTMDTRYIAMSFSLAVAVLMLCGKMAAFLVTGSNAILSDAAESVVHILATGFAAFSLWYSMQAPDRQHPYGHGKIAYFSAGFEGGMILAAAMCVFYLAARSLIFGVDLAQLATGLIITFALAILNGFLGTFLVVVGNRYHSLVLVANGKNVLTDMWTSFGVVAGVWLVWLTGLEWLDPVVAIAVALNISVTAYSLLRNAAHGLLDQADPGNTAVLLKCLDDHVRRGRIQGYHQLRHRQTEGLIWVELHVLVPEAMSTGEAHRRITAVEDSIRAAFKGKQVHITSHVEPSAHDDAHPEGHKDTVDAYEDENAGA